MSRVGAAIGVVLVLLVVVLAVGREAYLWRRCDTAGGKFVRYSESWNGWACLDPRGGMIRP